MLSIIRYGDIIVTSKDKLEIAEPEMAGRIDNIWVPTEGELAFFWDWDSHNHVISTLIGLDEVEEATYRFISVDGLFQYVCPIHMGKEVLQLPHN